MQLAKASTGSSHAVFLLASVLGDPVRIRSWVIAAGALPHLVSLVCTGSTLAQQAAVRAIQNLSAHPEGAAAAAASGATDALLQLMNSRPPPQLASHITQAIKLLSIADAATSSAAAASAAAFPTPTPSPAPVSSPAARPRSAAAARRSQPAGAASPAPVRGPFGGPPSAAQASIIDALVQQLAASEGAGDPPKSVMMTLAQLTCEPTSQAGIMQAGAVPHIVRLLSARNVHVQEQAAAVLVALVLEGYGKHTPIPAHQDAFVAAGALPPLVKLLAAQSAAAQDIAAAAVSALAANNDVGASRLVACAGAPPLVRLFKTGTAAVKSNAASALMGVCGVAEHRPAVVAAGAVPLIVPLLSVGSDATQASVGVLSYLCRDARHVGAVISAGAVPKLVALLRQRSTTEEVRSNVVDALAHITAGDTAARKSIVSAGALPLLVSELDATPINETSSAAMALNNVMAALPDTRAQVLAAGPLPALISRLRSSNGEVQEETATVLRSLTLHCPQHQLQLLGAGALPPLIALLTRGSARAQEQAAGLLVILTSHPEGRVPAISAAQPLLQLIRSPSASVGLRQEAAQVLVNLAADVETAAAMFDEGGVAILGDVLRQKKATKSLRHCVAAALNNPSIMSPQAGMAVALNDELCQLLQMWGG